MAKQRPDLVGAGQKIFSVAAVTLAIPLTGLGVEALGEGPWRLALICAAAGAALLVAAHAVRREMPAWRGSTRAAAPAPAAERMPPPAPSAAMPRASSASNAIGSMDEVSYVAGDPNVLTMTKYVSPGTERAADQASSGGAGVALSCREEGDRIVLAIEGALDALSAPWTRAAIERLIDGRGRAITVDLSAVPTLDSSGVDLLVGLYRRSRALGGELSVAGVAGQPRAVLRLLELEEKLGLSPEDRLGNGGR